MSRIFGKFGNIAKHVAMAKAVMAVAKAAMKGRDAPKAKAKLLKEIGSKMGISIDPTLSDAQQLAHLNEVAKAQGVDVPYLRAVELMKSRLEFLKKKGEQNPSSISKQDLVDAAADTLGEAMGDKTLAEDIKDGIDMMSMFNLGSDLDEEDEGSVGNGSSGGLDPTKEVKL